MRALNVTRRQNEEGEKQSYATYLNDQLVGDPDLAHVLPLDPSGSNIEEVASQGVLLCKFLQKLSPNSIGKFLKKPKNKYEILANHEDAIKAAASLGLKIVGINPMALADGKTFAVLGLLWQIIRYGLLNGISGESHSNLVKEGEDPTKVGPEEILLRWFNANLEEAGYNKQVKNFSNDLVDGESYVVLMNHLFPDNCPKETLDKDPINRFRIVIDAAERAGFKPFVTAENLSTGDDKLNLAFVATLFKGAMALDAELSRQAAQEEMEAYKRERLRKLEEEEAALKRRMEEDNERRRLQEEEERRRRELDEKERELNRRLKEAEDEALERARARDEEVERRLRELDLMNQTKSQELLERERMLAQKERDASDQLLKLQQYERELAKQVKKEKRAQFEEVEETTVTTTVTTTSTNATRGGGWTAAKPGVLAPKPPAKPSEAEEKLKEVRKTMRILERETFMLAKAAKSPAEVFTDEFDFPDRPIRKMYLTVAEAKNLVRCDFTSQSDPYVICRHIGPDNFQKVKHRTRVCKDNDINPVWNETMEYRAFGMDDVLIVTVLNSNYLKNDFMGQIRIPRKDIVHNTTRWFPLKPMKFFGEDESNASAAIDPMSPDGARPALMKASSIFSMFKRDNNIRQKVKKEFEITGDIRLEFEVLY
eukprot:TRINITY_DN3587_c0_g2_i1.p1 TRINITY_DN3587_c0_g2~~TRINITY_DN3587_c0_g2_i1.p1  ORF type:complete len:666 (-),score=307.63 TRINITY_DN3587_c0_g2_i1:16-1980(-)